MRRCPHTEAGAHRLYYECRTCRAEDRLALWELVQAMVLLAVVSTPWLWACWRACQ